MLLLALLLLHVCIGAAGPLLSKHLRRHHECCSFFIALVVDPDMWLSSAGASLLEATVLTMTMPTMTLTAGSLRVITCTEKRAIDESMYLLMRNRVRAKRTIYFDNYCIVIFHWYEREREEGRI